MNTRIAAGCVSCVAAAITVAACSGTDGTTESKGTVSFGVTAVNAGANAKPRLAPHASPISSLAVAAHTIDPGTYPVQQSLSGPPDEMIVTLRRISVEGPEGPQLLFGPEDPGDGSGPGVDLHLTNGAVDLTAAGLTLNSIRTGHYTRMDVSVSRSVKMRGCIDGLFAAQAAVGGTYNGQTYTTDTLAAGTHEVCTIASKGLLNFLTSPGPVGSDADYEAQAIGELTEFDIGVGSPTSGGSLPTTAQEVRDVNVGIPMAATEFDVGLDTPPKLTLVIDMNRMLRFWPNISAPNGFQTFAPPRQGLPPGTSYFYSSLEFERGLAVFGGDTGSIEGYQVTSEICLHSMSCMPGAAGPPDTVTKEWLTIVRDPSGAVLAGDIQADDAYGVLIGDIVPTDVVAGANGTFTLPTGLYRVTINATGTIDGFRFQSLRDPEDSATATPGPNAVGAVIGGGGPFPLWYTRRL